MTGNAMKPRNAKALEIIVSHIREFIEDKGLEAAKAAGFTRGGNHKEKKYPCNGWHKDAREIAKKILADKEFIRFCHNDGESPKKVVVFIWFYRHVKTAQVMTGIGKPLKNSNLAIHNVTKTMTKTIEEKQGLYLEFEDVVLVGRLFETGKSNRVQCSVALGGRRIGR
jgi:hypothetical protein